MPAIWLIEFLSFTVQWTFIVLIHYIFQWSGNSHPHCTSKGIQNTNIQFHVYSFFSFLSNSYLIIIHFMVSLDWFEVIGAHCSPVFLFHLCLLPHQYSLHPFSPFFSLSLFSSLLFFWFFINSLVLKFQILLLH